MTQEQEAEDARKDKVVELHSKVTEINLANQVLEGAMNRFAEVVVIGLDKDAQMSVLASSSDPYRNIAYMETAKTFITGNLLYGSVASAEEEPAPEDTE